MTINIVSDCLMEGLLFDEDWEKDINQEMVDDRGRT